MKKKDDLETRIDLDTDCRKTTGYFELLGIILRSDTHRTSRDANKLHFARI